MSLYRDEAHIEPGFNYKEIKEVKVIGRRPVIFGHPFIVNDVTIVLELLLSSNFVFRSHIAIRLFTINDVFHIATYILID